MTGFKFLNFVLLMTLFLSGCSAKVDGPKERFFFPPSPAEPKIEYLQGYFSDHDLKVGKVDLLTEYLLGETKPEGLFTTPVDVVSNGKGKFYVADSGKREVFVIDLTSFDFIRLSATDSMRDRAFGVPMGLAIDAEERVYIVDALTKRVDVFDRNDNFLYYLSDQQLNRPTAVAVDSEREIVYVVDTADHKMAKFRTGGELIGYTGSRGHDVGEFNYPTDVDVDENGHVYVLDSLNARVQVFDEEGAFLRTFGERGTAVGSFSIPKGIAVSPEGHVYVTDAMAHKFVVFSRDGDFLLRVGGKSIANKGVSPGGFYLPRGIDYDDNGGLWVTDSLNRMVHRLQYLTPEYLSSNPLD